MQVRTTLISHLSEGQSSIIQVKAHAGKDVE